MDPLNHIMILEQLQVVVDEFFNNNEKIPGFGHRYHSEDPRASKLLKIADEYGCSGVHTELAVAFRKYCY